MLWINLIVYVNRNDVFGKPSNNSHLFSLKAAEGLNEHIRTIENETKIIKIIKSFPNDELVSTVWWVWNF